MGNVITRDGRSVLYRGSSLITGGANITGATVPRTTLARHRDSARGKTTTTTTTITVTTTELDRGHDPPCSSGLREKRVHGWRLATSDDFAPGPGPAAAHGVRVKTVHGGVSSGGARVYACLAYGFSLSRARVCGRGSERDCVRARGETTTTTTTRKRSRSSSLMRYACRS